MARIWISLVAGSLTLQSSRNVLLVIQKLCWFNSRPLYSLQYTKLFRTWLPGKLFWLQCRLELTKYLNAIVPSLQGSYYSPGISYPIVSLLFGVMIWTPGYLSEVWKFGRCKLPSENLHINRLIYTHKNMDQVINSIEISCSSSLTWFLCNNYYRRSDNALFSNMASQKACLAVVPFGQV